MIPLVAYTGNRTLMGRFVNGRAITVAAWGVTAMIVVLNIALIVLTFSG